MSANSGLSDLETIAIIAGIAVGAYLFYPTLKLFGNTASGVNDVATGVDNFASGVANNFDEAFDWFDPNSPENDASNYSSSGWDD